MIQKLLSISLSLLLVNAVVAQPYPDEPHHWDIHDPARGDLGYDIKVTHWFSDLECDLYTMEICNEQGQIVSIGLIEDCDDGSILDVWSSDSGNWYEWHWRGTHYEKVGGSRHQRTYWPSDNRPIAPGQPVLRHKLDTTSPSSSWLRRTDWGECAHEAKALDLVAPEASTALARPKLQPPIWGNWRRRNQPGMSFA